MCVSRYHGLERVYRGCSQLSFELRFLPISLLSCFFSYLSINLSTVAGMLERKWILMMVESFSVDIDDFSLFRQHSVGNYNHF